MMRLEEHQLPTLPSGWSWGTDCDNDWKATRDSDGVFVYTAEWPSRGGLTIGWPRDDRNDRRAVMQGCAPGVPAAIFAAVAIANGIDLCIPAPTPSDRRAADRLRRVLVAAGTPNVDEAVRTIGDRGSKAMVALCTASQRLGDIIESLRTKAVVGAEDLASALEKVEDGLWRDEEDAVPP